MITAAQTQKNTPYPIFDNIFFIQSPNFSFSPRHKFTQKQADDVQSAFADPLSDNNRHTQELLFSCVLFVLKCL